MHKFVTLTADIMFVNGLAFFVILSRNIRLFTAEFLSVRKAPQLKESLKKIVNTYWRAGFMICSYLMDQEFEKLKGGG